MEDVNVGLVEEQVDALKQERMHLERTAHIRPEGVTKRRVSEVDAEIERLRALVHEEPSGVVERRPRGRAKVETR